MEKSSKGRTQVSESRRNRHGMAKVTGSIPVGSTANRAPNQHKRLGLLASGEVQEVVPGSRFDVGFPRLSRRDLVRSRDCQPTFLDHD